MISNKKDILKIKKKSIWIILYLLGLIICVVLFGRREKEKVLEDGILEVHFLSLGKADCILLQCGKEAMIIDAGRNETGDKIIGYLKDEKVTELKYAVATHGDIDHVGGMAAVLKEFRVKQLLISPVTAPNKYYEDMIYRAGKRNTEIVVAKVGSIFTLGDAVITVLAPGEKALARVKSTGKINNSSVVLRIEIGERSFLFMGDALHVSEQEMMSNDTLVSQPMSNDAKVSSLLRADVIKIGHHGFSDATSKEFLETVKPALAIITCSEGLVGHKNRKEDEKTGDREKSEESETRVESLLLEMQILTYHTGIEGSIVLSSDGSDIKVVQNKQ